MNEPIINTTDELNKALGGITFINTVLDFKWKFEFKESAVVDSDSTNVRKAWLVWVSFERPDTLTGKSGRGRGREEIVWVGTTLSGVVKTAWLLVELMVRHELMEGFRWNDQRIFNPHNSVLDLAKVQDIHDNRVLGTPVDENWDRSEAILGWKDQFLMWRIARQIMEINRDDLTQCEENIARMLVKMGYLEQGEETYKLIKRNPR